jgi:hypothetical protein
MASPVFVNSKELIALASSSPLFEIALVLVRLDHVASFIVNADHQSKGKVESTPGRRRFRLALFSFPIA